MFSRLWQTFQNSSTPFKMGLLAALTVWVVIVSLFAVGAMLLWDRPSSAEEPVVNIALPTITLNPTAGPVNTPVEVQGQAWTPNSNVFIYLAPADTTDALGYAVANAVVDPQGQFAVSITVPANAQWNTPGLIRILARASESEQGAQAYFNLVEELIPPIDEPGTNPEPTVAPPPVEPPQPGQPMATANTDLNIRSGPGLNYLVIGLLRSGQTVEITGRSLDDQWWQIKFSGLSSERGWVSAQYVTAQNTNNVPVVRLPVVQLPGASPTSAPQAPPSVVINDWRGEYYNNTSLSGAPALVRNDVAINFDWGNNAPASGLNADNYSARWTRNLNFPAGTYRFYARADDGVRLWLDNNLIIDRWQDSAPTIYTADVTLTNGWRSLKMEYYERTGGAIAQLSWQLQESYPDWKGEYFNNPNLSGAPALVRNDAALQFSWGPNAPGQNVPADNFSARWTRNIYFSAGTYRFSLLADDGARLWIDNNLIIDAWRVGEPAVFNAELTLSEGSHPFRVEYFDYRHDAQIRLDWERRSSNYPDWKAEYFTNRKLDGSPFLVRNETKIEYNWGTGSPAVGMPVDNFSARWTRKADFQAGLYTFKVKVDDGVRLWLNDTLIIDSWQDSGARTLEIDRQVSEGQQRLKIEYYERSGDARIELSWQKKELPANQLPQPNPGGPYTVDEGSQITLDGRNSRDPDGTVVTYQWDFNYNGRDFVVAATGPTVSARYTDGPAAFNIALRITDNQGGSQIAITQVTVRNVAPTAVAGGPYTGQVGNPITLAGVASDPGSVDQTGLMYRWEFGDGQTGDGPVVSHSYAQAGAYTARLTVTDKDGAQGSATATVQVTAASPPPPVNQPPLAAITGPSTGVVGLPLDFSGSGSSDSDGTITEYRWDFGDGSTPVNKPDPTVTYSYSAPGTYQVSLTVTDNGGLTHTATQTVSIISAPDPGNNPGDEVDVPITVE